MLLKIKNISVLITYLCVLASCSKTGLDEEKSQLLHELNNRDYETIIFRLEKESPEKLQRDGTLKYLTDAYLGYCGFDTTSIYRKVKKIEKMEAETSNPQSVLNQFNNAVGVIYSNKVKCEQYIYRANNLANRLDPNEQNIEDFNLYRGNLNLIETLYLVKNSTIGMNRVDIRNVYQNIEKIKFNIRNMKFFYGNSFTFLDDLVMALEDLNL